MIFIFKVTVAAAGTPGPLLGDGVKSTVTLMIPPGTNAQLTIASDSSGKYTSIFNQTTRQWYRVSRFQVYARTGNTGRVFFGGQGQVSADMIALDPATAFPAIGTNMVEGTDIGQFDCDVTTNGDGLIVIAEAN